MKIYKCGFSDVLEGIYLFWGGPHKKDDYGILRSILDLPYVG